MTTTTEIIDLSQDDEIIDLSQDDIEDTSGIDMSWIFKDLEKKGLINKSDPLYNMLRSNYIKY
jgi:hypothetical protein